MWLAMALCALIGRAPARASCHEMPAPAAPQKSCCAARNLPCHCNAAPSALPAHRGGLGCSCLSAPAPAERTPPSQSVRIVIPTALAVTLIYDFATPCATVLPATASIAAPREGRAAASPPRAPPFQG
ncbi:MAG TPA: hypothetical protein VFB21_07265 [Chthonomonadaceae bacterium]|nr:hypothetical protein [Chthonomonadaceae bacterium]